MHRPFLHSVAGLSLIGVCLALPAWASGQTSASSVARSIEGKVCDAEHQPIAGAIVILEGTSSTQPISATADSRGQFKFLGVTAGDYTLRAKLDGFVDALLGPFAVGEHDAKSIVLVLRKDSSPQRPNDAAGDIPFSDETHFTVAGVTDTTSFGGHGSDPVRRNSDALSRDAAGLSSTSAGASDESAIRERLAQKEDADLRFRLAELEEKSGRSLDAVNDYQRAAQLAPTESHLFAWGAELLLHRAFDPSIEVFGKGRQLYPDSARMILGLGSAIYAKGSADEAKQIFLQACDVVPSDPTPYLFLGRVQETETELPPGWTDRLKRFIELYPKNARAHYSYAVALTKQPSSTNALALAASHLKTAVELDPHFGDAYLELGILSSQQGDLPSAVVFLQKAVENTPMPDDAHYRLAQVYRRQGEIEKAGQETELYKEISEKKKQQVEQERHELQQFVYTLRGQSAAH